jgi:hypothetical protein
MSFFVVPANRQRATLMPAHLVLQRDQIRQLAWLRTSAATEELFEGLRRHPRWPELRARILAMVETLPATKVTPDLDR